MRRGEDAVERVAPGLDHVPIVFVNAYLAGEPGGPWTVADTGLSHAAGRIRAAAERIHGEGAKPEAIILTHGHFDHAGSVQELAEARDMPVYAHERAALSHRAVGLPPQDPTIGGAISFLSRFFPSRGCDLGDRVLPLPDDGSVPGMSDWRWLHTPGHTAGHVSLVRDEDRVLLAGDAVTTMDLDSWIAQVTREPRLERPPAPFTPDREAARQSVERLSALDPALIAAGHGVPTQGNGAAEALRVFAERFPVPGQGRHVHRPVRTDERGTVWMPPAPPDPLPARMAAGVFAVAALAAVAIANRRSRD